MKIRFLMIPLFALSAGAALAQPPDPKLALAHDVIQAMQLEKTFDRMTGQIQQMAAQMVPNDGTPEQQARLKVVQAKALALAMQSVKDMLPKMEAIYAQVFTADELGAIKAFYTSPAGIAMVGKQPEVMAKMTPLIIQMQRDLMPKIQAIAAEATDESPSAPPSGN